MAAFFAKCPSFVRRADGSASAQKLCIVTLTGDQKERYQGDTPSRAEAEQDAGTRQDGHEP